MSSSEQTGKGVAQQPSKPLVGRIVEACSYAGFGDDISPAPQDGANAQPRPKRSGRRHLSLRPALRSSGNDRADRFVLICPAEVPPGLKLADLPAGRWGIFRLRPLAQGPSPARDPESAASP